MRATIFAAAVLATSTAAAQPTIDASRAKAELASTFAKVIEALQRRDTTTLSRIYGRGYNFALGGGDSVITLTRSERLQAVAANPDSVVIMNLERCDFDVMGRIALGRCWIRQHNIGGVATAWTGIYTTQTWQRGADNRWRMLQSHASVNRPRVR